MKLLAFARTPVALLLVLVGSAVSPASSQTFCPGLDTCAADGHQFTKGSSFPYSEDITPSQNQPTRNITLSQSSAWTVLQSGCAANGYNNLIPGATVNVRLLGYLRIDAATAAPGAHYEVQFLIDGVPHGWYLRTYQGHLPQGDHFNAVAPQLPAGNHRFEIQARLTDPGTLTIGQQFTTSIGAPVNYPAFSESNPNAFTVNGTWQQASDTVSFNNATGYNIDIFPQAYFQMDSGTAGDQISFGFSLDGQTSVHTSDIGAPAYYSDGINVFDHIKNVSPGWHTLSFWLIDRNGQMMSVRYRQLEMISFPAGAPNGRGDNPMLVDSIATTPVTVSATATDHPAFQAGSSGCGGWTKLLEYQIDPTTGLFNYTGDGFVEILGANGSTTQAEVAIEIVSVDGGESDMHWVGLSVPPGRSQVYIYADSLGWSDNGETVRLWMRPSICNGSTGSPFTVGKRYLGLKLVPVDQTTCYN